MISLGEIYKWYLDLPEVISLSSYNTIKGRLGNPVYKIGEKLKVSSLTKAKFLLISGKPIGEPIARGGPFVMNTKEEILKAVQDYHNGTFVA